jgi:hypothetical protein
VGIPTVRSHCSDGASQQLDCQRSTRERVKAKLTPGEVVSESVCAADAQEILAK